MGNSLLLAISPTDPVVMLVVVCALLLFSFLILLIKRYKRGYFARNHPGGEPATRTSYFCCRPASAERQRLIQSRFDPKA